jgi:hypothetical protein
MEPARRINAVTARITVAGATWSGVTTMLPFPMDENWYENHWYGDQPRPKRRSLSTSMTRFALCILLVVGGAAVANHLHGSNAHVGHAGSLME